MPVSVLRRRILVAALAVLALVAIAVGVVLVHPALRPLAVHVFEPRDPAIVTLREESELRAAFNAHPERIRVVAWLSPT